MIELLKILGFTPKENTTNIYQKQYISHNNYVIEIDTQKKSIDFGLKIFFNDSKKSIQNFQRYFDGLPLRCRSGWLDEKYPT